MIFLRQLRCIINADHVEIKLYQLPDEKLIRNKVFNRGNQGISYIHNIRNGNYLLAVFPNNKTQKNICLNCIIWLGGGVNIWKGSRI